MIIITVTIDGNLNLASFIPKLASNIRKSKILLATEVTKRVYKIARGHAPRWKGDLKEKITYNIFPKTAKGEVFIAGSWLDQAKANANEFGVRPHYVDRDEYPEMDEWANDKGYVHRRHPNLVLVGDVGTRLGRQNKFFEPAFRDIQKELPQIMVGVIKQVLMKTRM